MANTLPKRASTANGSFQTIYKSGKNQKMKINGKMVAFPVGKTIPVGAVPDTLMPRLLELGWVVKELVFALEAQDGANPNPA
jgi:hypothetical protein